ncbi:ElaA protein [Jatrophihabitans sp. GAS493]|uniref:GNAT family N-acetyltransferase n=1 Tax=Jatrophihabitans sp. GAS493 TaxID=1907575 RepID=UPI000BB82606|nr:GNAT family N-acetyltransferase [Jatrophihabitans sp. GAS493]SOD72301.1 ElaA protein [Jatrophihabitans sp. GAS493]
MPELQLHLSATEDLSATTLYRILRLRSEIFVVEQECVYLDPDGHDLEPGTRQLWISSPDGEVLATLRVLHDPDAWRIGRVATATAARSRGLAAQLMRAAVDYTRAAGTPPDVVLNGQAHLEGWYENFGFRRYGDTYDEDGIPHVPMRLEVAPH